ncbi:MAG: hypothetical protein MAG715_01011 [Methanonatronarchaeales archaeon]|nr:hypothetical protein [Methanonatronarchaeales archaeon]
MSSLSSRRRKLLWSFEFARRVENELGDWQERVVMFGPVAGIRGVR